MNVMKTYTVATHNICHTGWDPRYRTETFPDHSLRLGYKEEILDVMRENWKKVYSLFNAELIGIQEYCPWFNLKHTEKTVDHIFHPLGYEITNGGQGLEIASQIPVTPVYETTFEPVSDRRLQKFYTVINEKRIAVFNCHPSPKSDQKELRQAEYRVLLEEIGKEEWVIAFGDFNSKCVEELCVFQEAGYSLANTGFGTVVDTGSACDNIIVSPNIQISNVELFDTEHLLSDHMVLAASLLIP